MNTMLYHIPPPHVYASMKIASHIFVSSASFSILFQYFDSLKYKYVFILNLMMTNNYVYAYFHSVAGNDCLI